nr:hypothetical protein [Burkholderia sp. D-99]
MAFKVADAATIRPFHGGDEVRVRGKASMACSRS